MGVPAPDNISSFPDKGFNFTRLGVRIPTLLISPWVPKGTVIKQPLPSEKPQPNSEFVTRTLKPWVRARNARHRLKGVVYHVDGSSDREGERVM